MNARTALAVHRLTLGGVALLAPRLAGRLWLDFAAHPLGGVRTRLMASRNLLLGVGPLASDSRQMLQLNQAVDLIDLATVTDETRRPAIPQGPRSSAARPPPPRRSSALPPCADRTPALGCFREPQQP